MPTAEEIVDGLKSIANRWTVLAVFWHAYVAAIIGYLLSGMRPSRRVIGLLLGPPLLSVSALAWLSANPFDGGIFALAGCLVLFLSARMPGEGIRLAQPQILFTGAILVLLGWFYPYFLETTSSLAYAYAAPTGLIPSPTLLVVVGMALVLNGLDSRPLAVVLGLSGVLYGSIGVFMLGIAFDVVLLLGAVSLLLLGAVKRTG